MGINSIVLLLLYYYYYTVLLFPNLNTFNFSKVVNKNKILIQKNHHFIYIDLTRLPISFIAILVFERRMESILVLTTIFIYRFIFLETIFRVEIK